MTKRPRFKQHRPPEPVVEPKQEPPKRLTEERSGMAASYFRLAKTRARDFGRKYPHLAEEIESAAMLGLCAAARMYDPARKVKFATYANWKIRGAMADAVRETGPLGFRREESRPSVYSLHLAIPRHESSRRQFCNMSSGGVFPPTLADLCFRDDDSCDDVGYQDLVETLADTLPNSLRRIWKARHLGAATCTLETAGRSVGLCESRASQLCTEANAILREAFAGREVA